MTEYYYPEDRYFEAVVQYINANGHPVHHHWRDMDYVYTIRLVDGDTVERQLEWLAPPADPAGGWHYWDGVAWHDLAVDDTAPAVQILAAVNSITPAENISTTKPQQSQ